MKIFSRYGVVEFNSLHEIGKILLSFKMQHLAVREVSVSHNTFGKEASKPVVLNPGSLTAQTFLLSFPI